MYIYPILTSFWKKITYIFNKTSFYVIIRSCRRNWTLLLFLANQLLNHFAILGKSTTLWSRSPVPLQNWNMQYWHFPIVLCYQSMAFTAQVLAEYSAPRVATACWQLSWVFRGRKGSNCGIGVNRINYLAGKDRITRSS